MPTRQQPDPAPQQAPPLLTSGQRLRVRVRHVLRWIRHRTRDLLGWMLSRLSPRRAFATSLEATEIGSVVICRVNARMGNTLFLTPLLVRLRELMPRASIDLLLSYPNAPQLLAGMPGVDRIIVVPNKTWRLWRYVVALYQLRRRRYDLAIDPTPESSSGRMALSLCRARYRLGFATPSQWAHLTHAVPLPREPLHQAVHPVYLLTRILGAPYDEQSVRLSLPLSAAELDAGRRVVAEAVGCEPSQTSDLVFGFFAHAATNKMIPQAWWQAFWEAFLALEPSAVALEILPSPNSAVTLPGARHLHLPAQRALTCAIAAMRAFITTDSGPMHLASATPVPTIGLFFATDPTLYRPLKPDDRALSIIELNPAEIARRCQQLWRRPDAPSAPQARSHAAH